MVKDKDIQKEEKEKSLHELVKEMHEKTVAEETTKKEAKKRTFKIPFKGKVNKAKAKKGYTTVLLIKENRNVDFVKYPIDEQTFMHDGAPRIATAEETLWYKGKPFLILPNWSTKPFSPTDNYQGTIQKQYGAQGARLLYNRMNMELIKAKKSISGMLVIGIIIGLIALGYFAYQGGLFS